MNKPVLIVIENLLLPIHATQENMHDIRKEISSANSPAINNGLFLMAVSFIESMQKRILSYYLKYVPQSITSKKTIEFNKASLIENEDFRLIEKMVSEIIDSLPYWQLLKIFYETLKIEKPVNMQTIQSIKDRRNELIHNNLVTDYKQKKTELKSICFDELSSSIDIYETYLDDLKSKISRKYGKYTRLNALKNLWHYTFDTPLCANFEDYWHINLEKDSIFGLKHPEYESSLSSSEKFMLDIWRSQVTEYKVDFRNMSSLGSHVQSCLYMFLKFSNDVFLY